MVNRRIRANLSPTLRSLFEGPQADPKPLWSGPIVHGRVPPRERMSLGGSAKRRVDYEVAADFINRFVEPAHLYFVDTNFFTGEEKPRILWDAIFNRRLKITPLVWKELQPWLSNPKRNLYAHGLLARDSEQFLEPYPGSVCDVDYSVAFEYYLQLLATRKHMGREVRLQLANKLKRLPDDNELKQEIRRVGAENDFQLMLKGARDWGKDNFYADEELVVIATMKAVLGGREVTILSGDNDVLEQFSKLVRILDVQYQAMLFAERFAESRKDFETRSLPRATKELSHYYADDEGIQVRRPHRNIYDFMQWLLPVKDVLTPIYLLNFGRGGDGPTLSVLDYVVEGGFSRLLDTKVCTLGLNTDQIEGFNCHVTGFPIGFPGPREWVAVVRDVRMQAGRLDYPASDVALANFERGEKAC